MRRLIVYVGPLVVGLLPFLAGADETRWLAVGMLHDWFSSAGCEIEVGRRHLISDQQDGLRWPAQYRYQDCKAAKALWIGATNYYDPIVGQTFDYKVVHCGPRVLNEESEFMPVVFKLFGKFERPLVLVDGIPAGFLDYMDFVDEVDPNLPADRVLFNVVNTQIGITVKRTIYAFSQQYHNNYFIYDYVFKNTGIIDKKGTRYEQTLQGVIFFFQYRYAVCREVGPYGYYWMPQSSSWGHNTMNDSMLVRDPQTGEAYLSLFAWHGIHSKAGFDNIGAPDIRPNGDGRLGAAQHVGIVVLHADRSATDKSHDPAQPTTTQFLGSDEPITSGNDPFNPAKMAAEYAAMSAGHPLKMHADAVMESGQAADIWGSTPGGFSHCAGFGPYTLAPGESIHIVIAEGVAGLSREKCIEVGGKWLRNESPFVLPDGSTTTNRDEYKDKWVFTGRDSLYKTFQRAIMAYKLNYNIPHPPPPPKMFEVTGGGDRIMLRWSGEPESWPGFAGYRIYRTIHVPDTTYQLIYECGPGVRQYDDFSARRGFDYYYYITSISDGSGNITPANPPGPLESSMFYTRTNEPVRLKRQAGKSLADIRVVPNPYNIRARDLQYGYGAPDRIMFLDLPPVCTIKIFTERGDLIETIEHTDGSGDEAWNSVTSSRQVVVSGVYIAYFETPDGQRTFRKFVIIR